MTCTDMRAKSVKDIWRQQERCRDSYHTFDNTKPPTKWLKKAIEISKTYMDNIAKSHPNRKYDEKFSYQTRIGQ